jgi:hypothetical protein
MEEPFRVHTMSAPGWGTHGRGRSSKFLIPQQ